MSCMNDVQYVARRFKANDKLQLQRRNMARNTQIQQETKTMTSG